MFLRCSMRKKDGKEHAYWGLVENRRVADGRVVQRHVLYLGEINDSQQVAWRRTIEIFDQGENIARTVALVPAEREIELSYRLDKERLRVLRRREGRYLLRSNVLGIEPAQLWELYIQLTQIEEAFRNLKGDLAIRPIFHQLQERIEAHIFVAFIAYCLDVTLRRRLHKLAPGLTPRAVLEKFKSMQMIDVHLPTTDGRTVILPCYTQPEAEHRMLLHGLNLQLPAQPKPRITAAGTLAD